MHSLKVPSVSCSSMKDVTPAPAPVIALDGNVKNKPVRSRDSSIARKMHGSYNSELQGKYTPRSQDTVDATAESRFVNDTKLQNVGVQHSWSSGSIQNFRNGKMCRSRESSMTRSCSESLSEHSDSIYHDSSDVQIFAMEQMMIQGSSKVYKRIKVPRKHRCIDYPEIIVPSPAQENSAYERLPPQTIYGSVDEQRAYPAFDFNSTVQFVPEMEYFRNFRPNMDDMDKGIVCKLDLLQKMVNEYSIRIRQQDELRVEEEKKQKIIEEQKLKDQESGLNHKPRRLSRSKTESKINENDHPKKKTGFFSRKRNEVDYLRKQMGQLHTDSE